MQAVQKEDIADKQTELIELLKQYPDILQDNPEILALLEVPHQSGASASLIERQL